MHIPLSLPAGPKVQQFMDQLNGALRVSSSGTSSGHAAFDSEGNFRAHTSGVFRLPSGEAPLEWTVIRDARGGLVAVEADFVGDLAPTTEWFRDASQIVTDALSATLAERQARFFRRIPFNYVGPALVGEYWLPGFRFAPILPEDSGPALINAERVVVFDMNVNAVDDTHAMAVGRERALRHAARVSLLANLALYTTPGETRWTIRFTDAGVESERLSLGFSKTVPTVTSMPKKGELCNAGEYTAALADRYRFAGKRISLPIETRRVLRGLESAAPEVIDAFDRCSRLYQVGMVCGRIYPSVGLAYRVAAVEAIVRTAGGFDSFADFMRKNVSTSADLEPLIDYLYGRARSAHFHSGEFPVGEFDRLAFFDPFMDAEEVARSEINRRGYEVIREAIVNWVHRLIPSDAAETANAE